MTVDRPPSPRPRGIVCPDCLGRLAVVCTKCPCPGVRIRHRVCTACGLRLVTREVVFSVRRPAPPGSY